jgi:Sulfotransferase family
VAWTPPARPGWLERLIAHGLAAGGPRRLVSLDADELVAAAAASLGHDDFGGDEWRAPYAALVEALESESRLHLGGRLVVRAELLRSLRNRLQLAALWRARPEILAGPLDPPVFVVGAPRSGTSILHELLACDPASRAPAMWEMLHPAEALAGADALPVADASVRFWHDLQPEYEAMHGNSGALPNECIFITMNTFLSDQWSGCHVVPSYEAHLRRADHRVAYRFHRRFLQALQLRARGERWVLKAPSHLSQLRALFEVYPEARVVHIHRDPLKTLPSALSLMGTLKWMRCEEVDLAPVSRGLPKGYAALFRAEIEQREAGLLPDARFVDVRYQDLMGDPQGTVERLYARLGWRLGEETRAAMAEHLAGRPRHVRGPHRYALDTFDLDAADLRERFRFYTERFGVPEEE